jgi:uncharacterized protein (DUF1697 family)
MPRYVAFLRGVSPMNAKMPELKACFEKAGFTDVKTVLSSGNVAFDARSKNEAALAREIEAAMAQHLDRVFATIVRSTASLTQMLEEDAFAAFRLKAGAKRIVTFLRDAPPTKMTLPREMDGARILVLRGREALSTYV